MPARATRIPNKALTGNFYFEKSQVERKDSQGNVQTDPAGNAILDDIMVIAASDVDFSGFQPPNGAAIDIAEAQGTIAIISGTADQFGSASGVAGEISFTASFDLPALGISTGAKAKIKFNTSTAPVSLEGPFGAINLDAGQFIQLEASELKIEIPGLSIEGHFAFRQATQNLQTREMLVGENIEVFIGNEDKTVGLRLTEGSAFFIREGTGDTAKEAGLISGQVELVGLDGVSFQSTMTLRVNETNRGITETFTLGDRQIVLNFTPAETGDFVQLGTGILTDGADSNSRFTISVADVVELNGQFTITRETGKLLLGAADVKAFIGNGPALRSDGSADSNATGLLVENIELGLVIYTSDTRSGYAFSGSGTLQLLGLDGLTADATIGLSLNRTSTNVVTGSELQIQEVDESIPLQGDDTQGNSSIALKIDDTTGSPIFSGGLSIQYVNHKRVYRRWHDLNLPEVL